MGRGKLNNFWQIGVSQKGADSEEASNSINYSFLRVMINSEAPAYDIDSFMDSRKFPVLIVLFSETMTLNDFFCKQPSVYWSNGRL